VSGAGEEAALDGPPGIRVRRRVDPEDDAALVRAARRGSSEAKEALARRHWDSAYRTAFLIVHDAGVAEDIAQEALMAALQAMGSFDRRRRFAPWLHRIVVNRSLDWLRSHRRRGELGLDETRSFSGHPSEADVAQRLSSDLLGAVRALDPEDRAIVVLRHLFDYRAREIGRLVGLPASTVRTRLQRALAQLRELLGEERI
jgi:RNA polymerase sigma-70 factor (ECF subfamily)